MIINNRTGALPVSPMSSEAVETYKSNLGKGLTARTRSREVCACGHSMNCHAFVDGRDVWMCSPARIDCKCTGPKPVLEAENLRLFLKSTTGVGAEHALGKGIVSSLARESAVTWLEEATRCDVCLEVMEFPIPISIDVATGRVTDTSSSVTKIVCVSCYTTQI